MTILRPMSPHSRRRRSVRAARGAASRGPARALLPDARLPARRRRRAAGDPAARLALAREPRPLAAAAALAVPDRDQRLPRRAQRRPKRVLSLDAPSSGPDAGPGEPLAESRWLEPFPTAAGVEERESVELAFVAALQHLNAAQRAVLIMREVLGFSAREVAEQLDTSTAAVNSSLQRARETLATRAPGPHAAGHATRARRRPSARAGRALHRRLGAARRRRRWWRSWPRT